MTLNCSKPTISYAYDSAFTASNGTRYLCVLSCSGTLSLSSPVSKLHLEGNKVVDESGKALVLRGVDIQEYGYRVSYLKRYNESHFQYLARQWEAKIIRIPVLPQSWRNNSGYLTQVLEPLVQWANKYGMYAIIDWHGEGNIDAPGKGTNVNASLTNVNETMSFWSTISRHFNGRPGIIYEIFNEPGDDLTWNNWKPTAQSLVDQIRTNDNDTIILVGGIHWSSDLSGALLNPVNGKNIAYVDHPYPTGSTFQQACKTNPTPCWDKAFGNVTSLYPVFATEWGYVQPDQLASCPKQSFALYWNGYETQLTSYFQSKGISWSPWNWSPDSQSQCYSMMKSWAGFQPTQFGAYVRSQLTTLTPHAVYRPG